MSHDDLERELEAAAPPEPPPELEKTILAAVDHRLAREGARRRALLTAGAVAVLMAGIFVLGMQAGTPDDDPAHPPAEAKVEVAGDPEPEEPVPAPPAPDPVVTGPGLMLDLPPTGLDFGDLHQGVVEERDVVFRNDGTSPLEIRRVENGCGCIKAKLLGDQTIFPPGEVGLVHVRLDTRGRDGRIRKTVTLYTNCESRPLRKFRVDARVALGMRISSTFLNFGRTTSGRAKEVRVRLRTPKAESDWEITEVRGTKETDGAVAEYAWHVEEVPDPQDVVRELVIVHPGLDTVDTAFQDRILVRTTYPHRVEIALRAHLLVVRPVLAVPRRAVLGFVPSQLPPPRLKLIPGDPDVRFKVLGIALEPPEGSGFEATHGREPGGQPWVEVRYDGKAREAGPIRAVLVVKTDLKVMPEIRIDCYATVQ